MQSERLPPLRDNHYRDLKTLRRLVFLVFGAPNRRTAILRFQRIARIFSMIKSPGDISVRSLASLDLENLIIRVEADDLVAYFDFEEVVVLDKSDVVGSLHKLNPPESITFPKLSFSGWIGFFGYEFLAANFGLSLNSRVDLDVPDGWFGRPQSLIRFGSNYLAIESQIPAREEEIRKLVNSYDFSTKEETKEEGTSGSLECNLDYVEYNKIFDLA